MISATFDFVVVGCLLLVCLSLFVVYCLLLLVVCCWFVCLFVGCAFRGCSCLNVVLVWCYNLVMAVMCFVWYYSWFLFDKCALPILFDMSYVCVACYCGMLWLLVVCLGLDMVIAMVLSVPWLF